MLRLFNSLGRQLQPFKPIKSKTVGLYTCGPTVYKPATLGNLRSYLFEDVLKRTLLFANYKVKHVMNVTDVGHLVGDSDTGEDKVEREAAKTGRTAWDIAREYETRFVQDLERLNIVLPDKMPRATDHINEQIALIKKLEKKGFTYRTSDGLYFDTSKFPDYGRLSGQKLADKKAGARVQVGEKKHPSDFALWKFSPADQKRQMEWDSPWGVGFPGWHVECSAMSAKYLGQPFDIHTGGVDHIPVHHENEIAQSQAAVGKPLANFWLHNEFLLVDGRRMGKSEGNAYTLDDIVVKGFDPLAFRYFCLGAHYRSKLNFTWQGLEAAQNALEKIRVQIGRFPLTKGEHKGVWLDQFESTLADDLNTPQALAVMWDMLKSDLDDKTKGGLLLEMDKVLGLELNKIMSQSIQAPAEIVKLAEDRAVARAAKDWSKADELRLAIEQAGWKIEDKNRGQFELTPNK